MLWLVFFYYDDFVYVDTQEILLTEATGGSIWLYFVGARGMEGKAQNIILIVHAIFLFSSIHDHANSHCFMKMLQGSLKETQYHWPNNKKRNIPLDEKYVTYHNTDDVTYINGKPATVLHLFNDHLFT